ncbi:MAG: type 2 isopentenyl-diphosphate Delta-isomerase [Spirochaetia bacterium]|nr:type 2 isopentenyl-diphosphate Delta-isomerase [Spirochaetia bacterium]
MENARPIGERKAKHLSICLDPSLGSVEGSGAGFEGLSFAHRALPGLSWDELDPAVDFLGKRIAFPFFISCMTGGSAEGFRVNRELALAARELGVPVGTGSIRVLLEHPELADHFRLKAHAPKVPLMGNIGAVQLRDLEPARVDGLVELMGADALVIHLNPGQELFEDDGDRDFRRLRESVAAFIDRAPYPVIVKETGFGIAPSDARFLLDAGAAYVDLAGSGGTNWISVEGYRHDEASLEAALEFGDWGYRTAPLLAASPVEGGQILASGGLRTGMDVAKALALGAAAAGMALPLARAASEGGAKAVVAYGRRVERVLKTVMLLTGSRTVADLRRPGVFSMTREFAGERDRIATA